jgi:hypothetical protein
MWFLVVKIYLIQIKRVQMLGNKTQKVVVIIKFVFI